MERYRARMERVLEALVLYNEGQMHEFRRDITRALGGPDVSWEYGPGFCEDRLVLSISCENDEKLLTRLVDELDIPFEDELISIVVGIPPREWDGYFFVFDPDGSRFEVDANRWKFWFDNRRTLIVSMAGDLPPTLQHYALSIFLTGELGEVNAKSLEWRISEGGVIESTAFGKKSLRHNYLTEFPDCEYSDQFRMFSK